MDFSLPAELQGIQSWAREFVEREILPWEAQLNATGEIPPQVGERMKAAGLYGLIIPQEYGGLGLGPLGMTVAIEQLGRAPKSFLHEVIINNGVPVQLLILAGADDQKAQYLPFFARGGVAAFALTEPNAGSDAASIETTATRSLSGYVIRGRKHFITNGATADVLIVMAATDRTKGARGGITAFLVERDTPGFSVGRMQETMAGPPVVHAELLFEDCEVGEAQLLGGEGRGFYWMMRALDLGRLEIGAEALGAAQRLLELSAAYSRDRVQFGRPIGEHQAIQFMLADMAMEIHSARLMLYDAAMRAEAGEEDTLQASMVKLYATEVACRVADQAVQIHGGMGYMKEAPVERMYRELRVLRIAEGTSEIQRRIIGRRVFRGEL